MWSIIAHLLRIKSETKEHFCVVESILIVGKSGLMTFKSSLPKELITPTQINTNVNAHIRPANAT